MPFITAHSGCENTMPDGLESIEKALYYHADGIEVDARLAPDGRLRSSHDLRTAEGYEERPLLEEALSMIVSTDLYVNVDIKEQKAIYPVLTLAKKLGLPRERFIISGCTDPVHLSADPEIAQSCRVFLNIEEVFKYLYLKRFPVSFGQEFDLWNNNPWKPLRQRVLSSTPPEWFRAAAAAVRELNCAAINLPRDLLTAESAAIFAEENCPVSVWTVREPQHITEVYPHKPYNITTTIPSAVIPYRAANPL